MKIKPFEGVFRFSSLYFIFFLTNYYPCDNANCRLCGYLLNFFLFCLFIDNSTLIPMNQTNLLPFLFNLFRDNRYSHSNIYSLLGSHCRCTISPSFLCSPPYVRIIPSRLYNAKQNILELEFTKKKIQQSSPLCFDRAKSFFKRHEGSTKEKKKKVSISHISAFHLLSPPSWHSHVFTELPFLKGNGEKQKESFLIFR